MPSVYSHGADDEQPSYIAFPSWRIVLVVACRSISATGRAQTERDKAYRGRNKSSMPTLAPAEREPSIARNYDRGVLGQVQTDCRYMHGGPHSLRCCQTGRRLRRSEMLPFFGALSRDDKPVEPGYSAAIWENLILIAAPHRGPE